MGDAPMTLEEYRIHRQRTCQMGADMIVNAALGIAGEAGEVADTIKKITFHKHSGMYEALFLELGDVLFYVDWLADQMGWGLPEIMEANVKKLQERYPEGWPDGSR